MALFRRVDVHGEFNSRQIKSKSVTADITLTEYDSGKLILMGANGIDITLPAPKVGMNFEIILVADYSTAVCTVVATAAKYLAGSIAAADSADGVKFDGSTHLTATFGTATLAGDRIQLISDGTLWFISGSTNATTNGITAS